MIQEEKGEKYIGVGVFILLLSWLMAYALIRVGTLSDKRNERRETLMEFQQYRKKTLTNARILTQVDHQEREGVVQTHEGPKEFVVGDYLARDALGYWPIPRAVLLTHYTCVGREEHADWGYYASLDIREATQMHEEFWVGGLVGKAGDYLVRSGVEEWPVDQEVFEAGYELVEEGSA